MIQQQSPIRTPHCNIYRLFLLSFGGIILLLVFRQRTTNKIITSKDTHMHTTHQYNIMEENDMNMEENDMKENIILPTVSYSLSAIVRIKKDGNNTAHEYALVHDKVDAAARKRAEEKAARKEQQYTLVHEKPPRGWWLPGGGVEHRDITPVDGAIREALEEAGSPSLSHMLPLFTTTQTNEDIKEDELQLLPSMSHLLSLEQSPGRQRFIFRGEWIDDDDTTNYSAADNSNTHNCNILKCPPGDDESEEAQWVTLDEVKQITTRQRGDTTQVESDSTFLRQMKDPWLRGHEPVTFFGLLEYAWQQNEVVPGLPVYKMNLSGNVEEEEEVIGAFFGRHTLDEESQLVYHGSRSALLTHLKCSLLVYDKSLQVFAIDQATNTFPSSFVSDQNEMSLKKLVDDMISYYNPSHPSADDASVGLLRVQHIIHENGREATLTVYPYIILADTSEISHDEIDWVPINELSIPLEKRLAEVIMDDNQMKEKYLSLEVLRDKESARRYTTHV